MMNRVIFRNKFDDYMAFADQYAVIQHYVSFRGLSKYLLSFHGFQLSKLFHLALGYLKVVFC